MKKLMTTLALAAAMLLGTATSALAFEPPADPAEKFSATCGDVASIVNGHPGATGQWTAILSGGPERTVGAWNATDDEFSNSGGSSAVIVCES